ncbi:MAG: orotidine-5'-phosphate decarboxylase [Gemmatimonadota bacterium]
MSPLTNLHARERLMLALDVPDTDAARTLVEGLGDAVSFYKIGLELFLSGGYFDLADWLRGREKKIFADLKLFDVPQTVASAVKQLVRRDVDYVTVHGNDAMLRAAVEAAGDKPGILAVTVLTSLDQADMADLGFQADISAVVVSRARRAAEIGCAGVIASGQEAAATRAVVPSSFRIVVPGIRPPSARGTDDQKRTVDVEDAFEAGADHIVIGRPIRNAPDPRAAAEAVQDRIASFFGEARVGR